MKTSSLAAFKYLLIALLIGCGAAWADDDSNTANSLTNLNPALGTYGGSSYPSQLYNSLSKEDANRWYEQGFGNFVSTTANATACLGGTSAGLTMTPTACVAYNAGYRGTETGPITFSNNASTWVAMDENTSGNNANLPNFTRVAATHYLIDTIDVSAPTMAFDSQLLMKVVTTGGAITAVTDERTTKVPGNILPSGGSTWTVPQGGTGDTTLTAHGILLGEGTSPIVSKTCGNNLFLAGVTSSDPACRALTTTDAPGVDGVTISGTPSAGQVLTATSSSAANWQSGPMRSNLQTGNPLATVSNSTSETTLFTYSLAGGSLTANGTLKCHAEGNYLNNSGGAATYSLKFYYGGSAVATTGTSYAGASATPTFWVADASVSTTGATNTEWASLVNNAASTNVANNASTGSVISMSRNNSVAVDSTTSQTVKLTVTMGSNTSTQTFTIYDSYCQLQ
jgi:hypothetical protein